MSTKPPGSGPPSAVAAAAGTAAAEEEEEGCAEVAEGSEETGAGRARAARRISRSPGVALTNTALETLAQNSSSVSGRLSRALGSLNPCRTSD